MNNLISSIRFPIITFLFFIALGLPIHANAAIKIQQWSIPSGAKVFFVETHALPIVDINISFRAGAAFDPDGKEGLAEMTFDLLELGSGDLDENQISEQLADLGARLSISTSDDRGGVSLRTLSDPKQCGKALALMATIIQKPIFNEEIIKREKQSTIAALKDSLTRPDTIANRAFLAAIYPGHPYGKQTTPESIAGLTREDIVHFFQKYLTADNAVISIVGDLSRDQAETIAEHLSSGLTQSTSGIAQIPPVKMPTAETIKIDHHATQAHIIIGLPMIKRGDPDFFTLSVGNYILGGGGFVSRLMQEVREKRGLAYSVYSAFSPRLVSGPFDIALQTKRDQANEALEIVNATLNQFLANGPTEEELIDAKKNIVGSFPLNLDSNSKLIANVATIGFYNLPLDWLDHYQNNIEKVTREDIKRVFSSRINKEHLVTVILAGQ